MDNRTFLYGLWTILIVGMFAGATFYGYSPFADGGRTTARAGVYGPTHK